MIAVLVCKIRDIHSLREACRVGNNMRCAGTWVKGQLCEQRGGGEDIGATCCEVTPDDVQAPLGPPKEDFKSNAYCGWVGGKHPSGQV